jgi:hypothetical protein
MGTTSATWQFHVPNAKPLQDNGSTTLGSVFDYDGDGYADVIRSFETSRGSGAISLAKGNGMRQLASSVVISRTDGSYSHPQNAGDINGDGYADLVAQFSPYQRTTGPSERHIFYGGPNYGGPNGISTTANATLPTTDNAQSPATAAGDVNGDGYGDIVQIDEHILDVPNPLYRLSVYYGGPANLPPTTVDFPVGHEEPNAVGAGDVDGNGFADIVVVQVNDVKVNNAARIYFGSSSGLLTSTPTELAPPRPNYNFGSGVTAGGDMDGDGFADVVISESATNAQSQVYVYRGGPLGVNTNAEAIPIADQSAPYQYYGSSPDVAGGGNIAGGDDLNGDGFSDVMLLLISSSDQMQWSERLYLVKGRAYSSGNWLAVPLNIPLPGGVGGVLNPQAGVGGVVAGDMVIFGDFDKDGFGDFEFAAGPTMEEHVFLGGSGDFTRLVLNTTP